MANNTQQQMAMQMQNENLKFSDDILGFIVTWTTDDDVDDIRLGDVITHINGIPVGIYNGHHSIGDVTWLLGNEEQVNLTTQRCDATDGTVNTIVYQVRMESIPHGEDALIDAHRIHAGTLPTGYKTTEYTEYVDLDDSTGEYSVGYFRKGILPCEMVTNNTQEQLQIQRKRPELNLKFSDDILGFIVTWTTGSSESGPSTGSPSPDPRRAHVAAAVDAHNVGLVRHEPAEQPARGADGHPDLGGQLRELVHSVHVQDCFVVVVFDGARSLDRVGAGVDVAVVAVPMSPFENLAVIDTVASTLAS